MSLANAATTPVRTCECVPYECAIVFCGCDAEACESPELEVVLRDLGYAPALALSVIIAGMARDAELP
jgi:hypothetical protein